MSYANGFRVNEIVCLTASMSKDSVSYSVHVMLDTKVADQLGMPTYGTLSLKDLDAKSSRW